MATFQEITGTGNPLNGIDVGFSSKPTFADIDSDGDLDAFIGAFDSTVRFYRNTSGTFAAVTGTGNPPERHRCGFLQRPHLCRH